MRFSFVVLATALVAAVAQAAPSEMPELVKRGPNDPCNTEALSLGPKRSYECLHCRVTNTLSVVGIMHAQDNKSAMHVCERLAGGCFQMYSFRYCKS